MTDNLTKTMAVNVVFSNGETTNEHLGEEITLGPFSQGVVIEQRQPNEWPKLIDVATSEVIADMAMKGEFVWQPVLDGFNVNLYKRAFIQGVSLLAEISRRNRPGPLGAQEATSNG